MNVRAKLLLSQSVNVALILAVALAALFAGYRFFEQLRRAELAYDQRQAITMLAVQAFRYKTLVGALRSGDGAPEDLAIAQEDARRTLDLLVRLGAREAEFVDAGSPTPDYDEGERVGRLEAGFAHIDGLVAEIVAAREEGSLAEVERLHRLVDARFDGEVAGLLAAAMQAKERKLESADADASAVARALAALVVGALALALLTSLTTGIFVHRAISGPILRLLAGVRALSGGDLRHRVTSQGADELSVLATQFNEMAAALEDREARLRAAGDALERKVAERTAALEEANARLKHLDRRRSLFLTDVSHELRTPVTVLRGEAEVTLRIEPKSPDSYRETLTRIVEQADQMGQLIDDLLFLARSESDTVVFDMQRVDLRQVVGEAVRDAEDLARAKGVALNASIPGRPIMVEADPHRLRQALLIGIDNAVKSSHPDSAITVSLAPRNGRAAITVTDTGDGVSAEDLPYVFERFYRIRSGPNRSPAGGHLGLPIAKWIAERHDGAISLSSRPAESTELTIELPRLEASPA